MKERSPITTLDESELEEQFVRASGPGGQNVNKVATRVVLRHIPTNIIVTVQDARTQAANRRLARERLIAALERRRNEAAQAAKNKRERVRRQKRPRPPAVKRRMVEQKRRGAVTRRNRARVSPED